jgi:hypothetical protein
MAHLPRVAPLRQGCGIEVADGPGEGPDLLLVQGCPNHAQGPAGSASLAISDWKHMSTIQGGHFAS